MNTEDNPLRFYKSLWTKTEMSELEEVEEALNEIFPGGELEEIEMSTFDERALERIGEEILEGKKSRGREWIHGSLAKKEFKTESLMEGKEYTNPIYSLLEIDPQRDVVLSLDFIINKKHKQMLCSIHRENEEFCGSFVSVSFTNDNFFKPFDNKLEVDKIMMCYDRAITKTLMDMAIYTLKSGYSITRHVFQAILIHVNRMKCLLRVILPIELLNEIALYMLCNY